MEATRVEVDQATGSAPAIRAKAVSVEWLAVICLAVFALALRVAELDSLPLTDAEARQALHAWHTLEPEAPGRYAISSSPLLHLSQLISFSALGSNAWTARLLPMLAGWLLTLTPMLFRDALGPTRAFVWAALLSLLALPIASSRLAADGTSFAMLFAILSVWLVRRYWRSQRLSDARWAAGLLTLMTLLSAPSGIPLLAILLFAGALALWRAAMRSSQQPEQPGEDILQLAKSRLRSFPLVETALVPATVILLTSTLFMLYPGGLATVAALLEASLAGLTQSAGLDGLGAGFTALVAHELLLIVFAAGGAWLLWRQGAMTYLDRFAVAWAGLGALGLVLYPGASAADAMWVALPLTLLASYGITRMLLDGRAALPAEVDADSDSALASVDLRETDKSRVKWLLAGITLAMLLVISPHFMEAARQLLALPEFSQATETLSQVQTQPRLLHALTMFALLSTILVAVNLLFANYYGRAIAVKGIGLGMLGIMLLSGMGGGWQLAAEDAANPNGLWRQEAISEDVKLLRDTLHELSLWRADGFSDIAFTVVEDTATGLTADGLVGWLLRDYPRARFVPDAAQAAELPIVLTADDESQYNQLGGDYVGQRFLLRRSWSAASQSVWDLPAWWTQSRRRDTQQTDDDALILWLRQDIYDGEKLDKAI